MNKREALELSISLWGWLAEHPDKSKVDCTLFDTTEWSCQCPLCEHAKEHDTIGDVCSNCILLNKWPKATGYVKGCLSLGSAYRDYSTSKLPYDITFFATIMVLAFQKELEEMNHGKS